MGLLNRLEGLFCRNVFQSCMVFGSVGFNMNGARGEVVDGVCCCNIVKVDG